MKKYVIDFSNCIHENDIHQIIKKGLDFPNNYDENWYACKDYINDFGDEKFYIEIRGLQKALDYFPNETGIFLNILDDYRNEKNPNLVIKYK